MDVEAAIESLNGKGQIYIDKVDRWEEAILSYFGRLNYNYKSRYMVEVNARYDGSSKFLPKNRWNFFWGASAGWRITEEKFMENLRDYVNELKLRASYGEVGNQMVSDAMTASNFTTTNRTAALCWATRKEPMWNLPDW